MNALTYLDDEEDPENQIVEYLVTAIPRNGLVTESVSNRVRIKRSFRLIFPTAFTPNKDRLNDTFSVAGQYVESMKLQVFDRWAGFCLAQKIMRLGTVLSKGGLCLKAPTSGKPSLQTKRVQHSLK